MKNLFKRNNEANVLINNDEMMKRGKRTILMTKVNLGLNAASLITTPVAVKLATDKIDDDYAKKIVYITGGILWTYQLGSTVNNIKAVKAAEQSYRILEECFDDTNAIEVTAKELHELLEDKEE